jgi:hypothetical protein
MPVRLGAGSPVLIPEPILRSFDYAYVGYVDPTAREWSLSDEDLGYRLTSGVAGFGSQAVQWSTRARSRGGVGLNSARYLERILTLPILVWGQDHMGFLGHWYDLEDAITRTTEEGPGYIRVVRPDGSERRIDCVYYAGWDNGQGDDWSFDCVPLQMFCPKGYWYDPKPVTVERSSVSGHSFYGPYPRVSSGRTLGSSTITNSGQLTTYATWQVDGPMTALEATITKPNGGTETFTVTHTLTGGQSLFITTDPPTIKDEAGDSLFAGLTMPGSSLWGIPRGTSQVDFAVSGSGAGTKVTLEFLRRFKMA